jgi:hypothetical protein
MPYAYYAKLKPQQKAIYRQSDSISELALPDAAGLRGSAEDLRVALERDERAAVQTHASVIASALLARLKLAPLTVKVLAVRPSDGSGELHGLYEPAEGGHRALITLWMRTAHHKKAVAFKTFLRTLLHELCHHLDYALLGLADSFHTEGFFKRESSLYHQIMDEERAAESAAPAVSGRARRERQRG